MNIRNIYSSILGTAVALAPQAALAQIANPGGVPVLRTNLLDAIVGLVNWFLILVGLIAVVFLVWGGVQYIISQGDEDKAAKAKNTILYAVIGLLVIGLSYVVVTFVFNAITNATV